MNRKVFYVLAAAAAASISSCGVEKAPAASETVTFENKGWGIKLEYPGDWEANAGRGVEPLILVVKAPGRRETVGAGVSVVGVWSAAHLPVVASSFERKIAAAGDVTTAEAVVGARPARVFEYTFARGGEFVWTRAVIVRGEERYYIITFASYEDQHETAAPYFESIERSIEVY